VLQRFKIVSYSGQYGSSIAKRRSLEETAMISLNLGRLEPGESYSAAPIKHVSQDKGRVAEISASPVNANSGRTKRSKLCGFALLRTASARFKLLSTSPSCGANWSGNQHTRMSKRPALTNLKTCYPHRCEGLDQLLRCIK
jgi:hypothetical protein